jgi:hypothetical protein
MIFVVWRLRDAAITFQRAANRGSDKLDKTIAEPACFRRKNPDRRNKKALLRGRHCCALFAAAALPRSNQIEATLFGLISQRHQRGST